MKLKCSVEKLDRQLPSLAMRSGRPLTSLLSIGKGNSAGEIRILHQTTSNKQGTIYKVKDNIDKIFTRFIKDGKATIRFKAPPHDLCIHCNAIELKSFLNIVSSALQGKDISIGGGGLSNLSSTPKIQKAKTKLVISSKSEYPTLEGFPRTLHELHINKVKLTKFDSRILHLQILKTLDLSKNCLKILPPELGNLPNLALLNVSHNLIGSNSHVVNNWNWLRGFSVTNKLQTLDISNNRLPVIPGFLGNLTSLSTLKLDYNCLLTLHSSIGKMSSLSELYASNNHLSFLPGSILQLNLEYCNLAANPFDGNCITTQSLSFKVLTLQELAARKVIGLKIKLGAGDVPENLLLYINSCDFCFCGEACFNSTMSKIAFYDVRKLTRTLELSMGESNLKPVRICACSERCIPLVNKLQ